MRQKSKQQDLLQHTYMTSSHDYGRRSVVEGTWSQHQGLLRECGKVLHQQLAIAHTALLLHPLNERLERHQDRQLEVFYPSRGEAEAQGTGLGETEYYALPNL